MNFCTAYPLTDFYSQKLNGSIISISKIANKTMLLKSYDSFYSLVISTSAYIYHFY